MTRRKRKLRKGRKETDVDGRKIKVRNGTKQKGRFVWEGKGKDRSADTEKKGRETGRENKH